VSRMSPGTTERQKSWRQCERWACRWPSLREQPCRALLPYVSNRIAVRLLVAAKMPRQTRPVALHYAAKQLGAIEHYSWSETIVTI